MLGFDDTFFFYLRVSSVKNAFLFPLNHQDIANKLIQLLVPCFVKVV